MSKNRCARRVYAGTWHGHPCKLPAVIERDGKWYCKRHDPVAERARRDKRSTEMLADIKQRMDSAERQKRELAELERDAARYRWLREEITKPHEGDKGAFVEIGEWSYNIGDALDAAIDAAISSRSSSGRKEK